LAACRRRCSRSAWTDTGRQRDGAAGSFGLGVDEPQIPVDKHQRPANPDDGGVEIDVGPLESECFAAAQTDGDRHGEDGLEPVALRGVEQRVHLIRRQGADLRANRLGWLDQGGDVAG